MTFNQTEVAMIVSYLLNPNNICSYSNSDVKELGHFTVKDSNSKQGQQVDFIVKANAYEAATLIVKTYEIVESNNAADMQRLRDAKSLLYFPEFFAITPIGKVRQVCNNGATS